MKLIKLTRGKFAVVDDEDYKRLNQWDWIASKGWHTFYARHKDVYMHRLILNAQKGTQIDHKDGNGLNNQKENLRFCSNLQNQHNQRPCFVRGSSRYKGVVWHKRNKKWQAQIGLDSKVQYIGSFDDETKAALAYDKAAKMLFGKFAKTNF